jgi:hypothetical protein
MRCNSAFAQSTWSFSSANLSLVGARVFFQRMMFIPVNCQQHKIHGKKNRPKEMILRYMAPLVNPQVTRGLYCVQHTIADSERADPQQIAHPEDHATLHVEVDCARLPMWKSAVQQAERDAEQRIWKSPEGPGQLHQARWCITRQFSLHWLGSKEHGGD